MDPRLLAYYNEELQHVREMGGEFAHEFPKIAARLGLEGLECADPYVERLLEGFAFLAARVRLKVDAEFPRFSRHLLEMVYPHYLAPTPSMAVVQMVPDSVEGALQSGYELPRDTVLRSQRFKGYRTACEYRTAHAITLWPIEVTAAEYLGTLTAVRATGLADRPGVRAGIRIRLRCLGDAKFDQLPLQSISFYLGNGALPYRLYEQIIAHGLGIAVHDLHQPARWGKFRERRDIRQLGFETSESLLPPVARSFDGYRLLQEYFALPERFLFVELGDIGDDVRACSGSELELILPLARSDPELEGRVDAGSFALFCTPAINLFPKRLDRIHLRQGAREYHVVPDRGRPMDFEVFSLTGVSGHGTSSEEDLSFQPFYACADAGSMGQPGAYYAIRREPRVLSSKQRRVGTRSRYVGHEIFLSLVDATEAPYSHDLRQLGISALCTNRDMPLHMPVGKSDTDFHLESGAPVRSVRCLAGPSEPRPTVAEKESAWRLISQLSLNYLSLLDDDTHTGAAALRQLLALYVPERDESLRRQLEGVSAVSGAQATRRMPVPGPISFGRGFEIIVDLDETAFEGMGVFLLGAVLERFFARYASINSFTETRIRTQDRGEIMRWPVRTGKRQTL